MVAVVIGWHFTVMILDKPVRIEGDCPDEKGVVQAREVVGAMEEALQISAFPLRTTDCLLTFVEQPAS